MLAHVVGRAGPRKLRLLAVAAARELWPYLPEAELREAVEAAERCADGLTAEAELRTRRSAIYQTFVADQFRFDPARPVRLRDGADLRLCGVLLTLASLHTDRQLARLGQGATWPAAAAGVTAVLPGLIRDILGDCFHPVPFDPAWRSPPVLGLAAGIDRDRAFDRLPVLADVLEEAGCDEPRLLAHCRAGGPHVRGCWAVDLVHGREDG